MFLITFFEDNFTIPDVKYYKLKIDSEIENNVILIRIWVWKIFRLKNR